MHQLLQIHTGPFEQMAGLLFRRVFNDSRGKIGIRTEEKIATQVWRAVAVAAVSRAANQTLHTAEALQLGQTLAPNDEHVNLGHHLPDLLQPSGNLGQPDVLVVSEDSEEDITDEEVRNNFLEEELL